jgi:chemotaxis protein MotB
VAIKKLLGKAKDSEKEPHHHPRHEDHGPAHAGDDESNWLVSYADMMTLLCGFFIMLFSMAKLDDPKYEKVKESVAKQFGGEYKSPNEDLAKYVSKSLEDAKITQEAVVRQDPMGVSVVFQSALFFDTLSSDVKAEGRILLTTLIEAISRRQAAENRQYKIVVEGHTDSRPITGGVYPSNWELSGARAARVVRMFLDRSFRADHLVAIGYADTHPEVPVPQGQLDADAHAKNRRVVLRILNPSVDAIPFPNYARELAEKLPEAAPERAPAAVASAAPAPASSPLAAPAAPGAAAQPGAPVAVAVAPVAAPSPSASVRP